MDFGMYLYSSQRIDIVLRRVTSSSLALLLLGIAILLSNYRVLHIALCSTSRVESPLPLPSL